jgi:hypothetical protein
LLEIVAPNAGRASQIALKWATFAKAMGFKGIFWSTMGSNGGHCAGCDWPGFLTTAHQVLQTQGLEQSAEFISGYGWANTLMGAINPSIAFPVWSMWSFPASMSASQLHAYASAFYAIGKSGITQVAPGGAWATTLKTYNSSTAVEIIIRRMQEAACHNCAYVAIVDGENRIFSDYYPDSKPLSPQEVESISKAIQGQNPLCKDSTWHLVAKGLAMGLDLGIDSLLYAFHTKTTDSASFLQAFKQALLAGGLEPSVVGQLELHFIEPASANSSRRLPAPTKPGKRLAADGATMVVEVMGYADAINKTRTRFAQEGITVNDVHACQMEQSGIVTTAPKHDQCVDSQVDSQVAATTAPPVALCEGPQDSWTAGMKQWCCDNHLQGCSVPWWKEVLLYCAVALIAIGIAICAYVLCKRRRSTFSEREAKSISRLPRTSPGDEAVDDQTLTQTPLVSAKRLHSPY